MDDSSSEDGEDSDDADVNLLLRGGGKHGDTDDEGIERDHDDIDLEQPRSNLDQQSSLESESSSTSSADGGRRDPQRGPRQRRQHRSRGDRGGGGETDAEVVATDGSIEKVLSLCCNHLVSPWFLSLFP